MYAHKARYSSTIRRLTAAVITGAAGAAWAQAALEPSRALSPPPRGDASRQRPLYLMADELRVRPDLDATAEGRVELRRAGTVIRADRMVYDSAEDLALPLQFTNFRD